MTKFVIQKAPSANKSLMFKATPDIYNKVSALSKKTGVSRTAIVQKAVEYALNNTE